MNWNNFITTPNRWMAYWLRSRGWVAFYLDKEARTCNGECWLKLYEQSEAVKENGK